MEEKIYHIEASFYWNSFRGVKYNIFIEVKDENKIYPSLRINPFTTEVCLAYRFKTDEYIYRDKLVQYFEDD